MSNLQDLKEDFEALLKCPGWDRLLKAVADAIEEFHKRESGPIDSSESIATANYQRGVIQGLELFRDFPGQQIAAAKLKMKQKQELDNAPGTK